MLKTCVLLSVLFALTIGSPVENVKNLALMERLINAQRLVDQINSKQSLWKAEVNPKFSLMDQAILKGMMGLKRNQEFKKAFAEKPPKRALKDDDLPKEFDSRKYFDKCTNVISKIQDQSRCGSCWAVSSASVMTDRTCIASEGKIQLEISAKEVTACANGYGCEGGWPAFAFDYWKNQGVVTGGDFEEQTGCQPYPFLPHQHGSDEPMFDTPKCEKKCQQNYTIAFKSDKHYGMDRKWWMWADEVEICEEIYKNGPLVAGFDVYEDFMQYKSGIYKHVSGDLLGGHAVRIIGWGEEKQKDGSVVKYWLVSNSWNTDWGEEGTFRMIRGINDCDFESDIAFATANLKK